MAVIGDVFWYFLLCINYFCINAMPAYSSVGDTSELDIAFLLDTTGSMGSYINNARQNVHQIVTELVQSSQAIVEMALIEYRDHPPQDDTFVIRQHDFTGSIRTMEKWLNDASANGGGDGPEAVADALDGATKLSWRPNATKIAVLISDAPPHGLDDNSYGCPNMHDPMQTVRYLADMDVTLYSVGAEPSIVPYTDFFMGLAYITGGQYLPLNNPNALIDAIIGGAHEELSLQKFENLVQSEIQKALSTGSGATSGVIDKTQIVQTVYQKLSQEGATSVQLLRNNQTLENATEEAKIIAGCRSMAEVRKVFKPRHGSIVSLSGGFGTGSFYPTSAPGTGFLFGGSLTGSAVMTGTGTGGTGSMSGSSGFGTFTGTGSGAMSGSGSFGTMTGSSTSGSHHPDSYSYVETGISVDQINRLVNKEVAKVTTSS